ncbi:MAG TPA: hypothetical protein VJI69_09110 [Bacteroidia bacterium]|nr:hypothetical protein [Bacteroidia bacterium]
MYSINDKQIDFILNDIRARGVEMEDLQYNLLDHVCCMIEQNLEANGDFENFYQKTIRQFYKHELWEIEEETIALQIFKHYYTMKKLMIGTGIISAVLMIVGIFFKFMHWPGAAMFLVLGIGCSSLIFLPLLFTLKIKEKKETKEKVIVGIGTLAGILMSLGILFKVMHWPGANMMGLGAVIMMLVVFLPIYFISGIRNPETKVNTIVSSILIIMGCGLFFTLVNTRPSIKIQNSIAYTNQKVADSYEYLSKQNAGKYKLVMSDTVSNTKGLSEVNKKCNDLCTSIEKLKLDLLFAVEGVEFKKVDYKSLTMPDNFDIPSRVLFDQKGKAKSELNQLKKELNALNVLASSEFKLDSSKLIDLSEKPAVHEQGMELWEVNSFYHTPISLVLQNLTQLQLDIRIVEAGCLK